MVELLCSLETAGKMPLFAIAVPVGRATGGLPGRLEQINMASYVHTINMEDEANRYMEEFWLTDVYTDYLPPAGLQKNPTE